MVSPVHAPAHPMRPKPLINTNPNANLNHLLNFSSQKHPEQKGFFQKVIPVVRRIGAVAGKVSDVAGKVAVVASIL